MGKTREIEKRLKAVGNIKRITRTMQLIATAKFQASVRRATETKPYTEKVAELVQELAGAVGESGDVDHPLLSGPTPASNRELLLVVTSNRGLCGGYNGNVLRKASTFLKDNADKQIDLEVAGKKGTAYFQFAGKDVRQAYTQFGDKPAYDDVNAIAERYIDSFSSGIYDAVRVIYMKFVSNSKQVPEVLTLMPLSRIDSEEGGEQASTDSNAAANYEFSPNAAELLGELLPVTVKTQLFQVFNESVVSEQIARMVAMKAATDNADKMGKSLKREFNRARQAQITTELTEIITGAQALG